MDEQAALHRVKTDLARAWFAAPGRIAELSISKAEPAHCGEFVIESIFVSREASDADEPLTQQPSVPPLAFDLWSVEWPPGSDKEVDSRTIDVRTSYEVLACPACSQAGETTCGVCRGSGKVQDPSTHKAIKCDTCKGSGSVICPRCNGRRSLLRFKRVAQRVDKTSAKIQLPDKSPTPTGVASGELRYAEATPSGSDVAVALALKEAAPALDQLGWVTTLSRRFADAGPTEGASGSRAAWRTISGRWYEGWRLECTARGKKVNYFVPDTGAKIVGPHIRSPAKIAALAGLVTALIVGAVLIVSWRLDVANDEREAQTQHEAAVRVAEKQRADDAAAKAVAESKAQAARDAEAALKARLADVDSMAAARIAKHQERLACMALYFACSPSDDSGSTHGCEKPADYDLTTKIPDDDPVRKVPSWTAAKCDKLLPDFERQNKQALDKAAREEKIKAAKTEHDEKRYANRCGGDYASEGVRVVDQGVEYELMTYTRSGGYVAARVRLRNTSDSPADGLSLGYSQAVTTDGKEYDLDGGGCTPDALNPGQSIACTLTFAVPKEQEVEGIKVSTLSKWHFAGSLCVKEFVP